MCNTSRLEETFISLQDNLAYGFVMALVMMSALNLVLHSVATFLLLKVYQKQRKQKKNSIQVLNLVNLSITQLIASLVVLIDECSELIYDKMEITQCSTIVAIQELDGYLYIVIFILYCTYYVDMIIITLNKFFAFYLNIRYPVFWDVGKSKRLICALWLMSLCTCGVMCVVYMSYPFNYQFLFTEIVSPVFIIIFLTMTFVSYVYIFCQYRHSRTHFPSIRGVSLQKRESIYTTFRSSNFHLCALLVGSFIVFMVAPNLGYLLHCWAGAEKSHVAKDAIKVSHQLSFLADFVIYVIMQPEVRRLGVNKFDRSSYSTRRTCNGDVVHKQTSLL